MPTNLSNLAQDPVPALARAVIDLFAEALPEVRFPDMDRDMLESAADELRAAQLEVEQLEAELAAAKTALSQRAEQLSQKAQRALSYARIFAEGDSALSERVAQIQAGPASPKAVAPVKRRGRPKRDEGAGEAGLFGASDASMLEAAH